MCLAGQGTPILPAERDVCVVVCLHEAEGAGL